MKKNRIIYGIVWILSLVLISLFGGAVSYGIFAMVTILPFISIGYVICVGLSFHIYQELGSNTLTAGEVVPFYFSLMNEHFFGYAGIRVLFFDDFSNIDRLASSVEYELLPQTGIERQTRLICKYRGEYEVGIRAVEICDYLRLVKWTWKNKETLRVNVRPGLVKLSKAQGLEMLYLTARDSNEDGVEQDLLLREYQPGDDIRQINWKAYARSGQLLIRKRISEKQEGAGILFSTYRKEEVPKTYLPMENKILELVLAISYYLCNRFIPVQAFGLQEGQILGESLSLMADFEKYYETLSHINFAKENEEETFLGEMMHMPRAEQMGMCFLVVQEITAQTEEFIKTMNLRQVQCVVYLIRGMEEPGADQIFAKEGSIGQTPVYLVGADVSLREEGGDA